AGRYRPLACTRSPARSSRGRSARSTTSSDSCSPGPGSQRSSSSRFFGALAFVVWALLHSVVHHAAVALVGGRGGFGASLWTNAYFSAFLVAWWPISLLGLIPWVGPVIRLVGYLAL